jgi:ABC-2 type transport system permease protein
MRLTGLASGATVGGYTMIRGYVTLAVLAALMSTFAVVRHTRQGEETGRAELVGAAVVGRHAALAAALTVTVAADLVLAVLIGIAMVAMGQPAAGSFVAGAAVGAVGITFAGVAAITCQFVASTRGASGVSAAVLGVAFVTSGVANMAGHPDAAGLRVTSAWPAWLSPIGWGQQMRPFGGDHWWPAGLAILAFAACVAVAARLAAARDFGMGMLAQRPGHAGAGRSLRSPLGLAWRLQRTSLLGWAVGLLGFGLILGGAIGQMRNLTGAARDWYARMGSSDQILDAYRASIIQMAGMAAAIYVVQVLLHMRTEEADGQVEPVLATAVSRPRWVASHAVSALLGATALMLVFAVGMGLAAGGVLGNPAGQVWTLVVASLVQLPGVLAVGAVVVAAIGLLPRLASAISWAVLLAAILVGPLFGPTLRLPGWVQDLSPFTHTPRAPAVPITAAPLLALTAVVIVFGVAGVVCLRRRNLALPA